MLPIRHGYFNEYVIIPYFYRHLYYVDVTTLPPCYRQMSEMEYLKNIHLFLISGLEGRFVLSIDKFTSVVLHGKPVATMLSDRLIDRPAQNTSQASLELKALDSIPGRSTPFFSELVDYQGCSSQPTTVNLTNISTPQVL